MPSKERYLNDLLNDFIKATKKKKRSPVTVSGYRWMVAKVQRELLEAERDGFEVEANPKHWDEETVRHIIDVIYSDNLPSVVRRNVSVLGTYAAFHGNSIVKDLQLEWPADERVHVDWLTPTDALRVMEAAEGMERIIIHLELKLGLRRVEVLRMKLQDIGSGYLDVLGKGRQGGKRRTVAFHRETMAELEYYLKLRDAEIMRSEGRGTIPDSLLIYFGQGRELHTYKRTAVDVRLARVAKRTGLKFTNHTLRRTYGRTLWLAGVPLETISSLMGHEDTKTTTQYLGLNMDDKESAMRKLAEFESAVKCGKNLSSSQISGQSGTTARKNIWIANKLP
jgi:integrase/recombinase XerD